MERLFSRISKFTRQKRREKTKKKDLYKRSNFCFIERESEVPAGFYKCVFHSNVPNLRHLLFLLLVRPRDKKAVTMGDKLQKVKVCRVLDGDTVALCRIHSNRLGKELKIRLYGIDAPERSQTYGELARLNLDAMIKDNHGIVYLQSHGRPEKYGRTLGTLYSKRHPETSTDNINYKMVLWGSAWSYRFRKEENSRPAPIVPSLDVYDTAQTEAILSKRGLWEGKYSPAIEPSKYRHAKRRKQHQEKLKRDAEKQQRKMSRKKDRQAGLSSGSGGENTDTSSETDSRS